MVEEVIKSLSVKEIQLCNAETGTLTDSAAGDVKCDKRLAVTDSAGSTYYIPLFDTAP